ncbi:MAG: N-6 DNA methylase [Planctomycetaceae bacterium]
MLTPTVLNAPLRACGYRRELLRADFQFGKHASVPLVGFAQVPTDSRSACIAVLGQTSEPRIAVEACRELGAPLVFVCFGDTIQWWKQGSTGAEWRESIPEHDVATFFHSHQSEFSPDAIYRAKTWGGIRADYQLDFVDAGLMPLVEKEVGQALSRLIERTVTNLKAHLKWKDVTTDQGHWLIKAVFWLVSGKILRDKQVPNFNDLDLIDVEEVFRRVATHYGAPSFPAGSSQRLSALRECASIVDRFSSLALTTTESLAHVYENALISKETRSSLGTHSTPSFLVDYIVGNLEEWIREIPENERNVFEPACGHAAFLVSAMRLLTQLLPPDRSVPSRRGPYLRRRLHGIDIDAFSLELARLSLTLTDIPNPDGWDLRPQDMFLGKDLVEQSKKSTILLANPPFANFKTEERDAYARQHVELTFMNRTAEVLWRSIPNLPPGGVFGVVVPQTLLHSANATELRRFLLSHCELQEICLFPDKVFSFSDAESAIILGRRCLTSARRQPATRYRHVRESQMKAFQETFKVSRTESVLQSQLSISRQASLRVADLATVWNALSALPELSTIAEVGKGLEYHGARRPEGALTFSRQRFAGAVRGYTHFDTDLQLHEVPTGYWMSLDDDVIRRRGIGATTGIPQVLFNYAPVSRGPWRLKAVVDNAGKPVNSNFVVVRPRDQGTPLLALWSILNSPVANAYAFCHLGKRHNIVGRMRTLPVPVGAPFDDVVQAASEYLHAVAERQLPAVLQSRLLRVDIEVLRLYSLPAEVERPLLDLFNSHKRVGVPFRQVQYIPSEFTGPIRLFDFMSFANDWAATNRERGRLIDKRISGRLSPDENARLDALQAFAEYYVDKGAPRPTRALEQIEELLLSGRSTDPREE